MSSSFSDSSADGCRHEVMGDDGEQDQLKNEDRGSARAGVSSTIGHTMALPLATLSSLLAMQDVEDHKPRLSKISWLPDILVFRSSILPIVIGPVLTVTVFSAGVAAAQLWWGKEVGLTNSVVPLLSVVVGLLLVFRNSSAYERYAEGRKDFTTLISNARNLSRNIWVVVSLPPTSSSAVGKSTTGPRAVSADVTRRQLTLEKKGLIRLIVAFVVATKHHLRAEGGVHHDDLRGLLPSRLAGSDLDRLRSMSNLGYGSNTEPFTASPRSNSDPGPPGEHDEEASLGLSPSRTSISPSTSSHSRSKTRAHASVPSPCSDRSGRHRRSSHGREIKRRPTAVRIVVPEGFAGQYTDTNFVKTRANAQARAKASRSDRPTARPGRRGADERTPLIKAGVKPDPLTSLGLVQRAEAGLGNMVELGLPLIIAHEITRTIFRFRRMGFLEAVGPAGMNAMQSLVQNMTDQLGSMERIVQTPLPYIFCIHLKQVVSLYLFILPFTLVDSMGWKMVPIMFGISLTFMGVEGIAAMIEMPFGTDPCDLNLDLYCTELLCECEAILERLPEGDEDESDISTYERSADQLAQDYGADDGGEE